MVIVCADTASATNSPTRTSNALNIRSSLMTDESPTRRRCHDTLISLTWCESVVDQSTRGLPHLRDSPIQTTDGHLPHHGNPRSRACGRPPFPSTHSTQRVALL